MGRRFTATIGVAMMLALMFAGTVRFLGSAEEAKIRGLIVGRTGDTLAVKTDDGNITVMTYLIPSKMRILPLDSKSIRRLMRVNGWRNKDVAMHGRPNRRD